MRAHEARVVAHADAFVDRRSRGAKHPVHDFLFTYYSFAPAKLKQWVPPLGASMEVVDDDLENFPWLRSDRFIREGNRLRIDERRFTQREREFAAWVAMLCRRILGRAGRFTCFGLHEWAMVYRQSAQQVRHQGYELRLPPSELAAFVESLPVCCSHYDAFRFFTPEARPLNSLQPTLDMRPDLEQSACLHANMDLYKWSSKLWPWTGADLIGECFELALAGRDLDMRASPYDLGVMGYKPVKIETAQGRAQYEQEQRELAARSAVLRQKLLVCCESLALVDHPSSDLLAQADERALR
ncbi:hypothetical protein [Prosthecobacter sp.]|uniref:hypothetical protein n=1 Tax=Prosthecobacter sp. TaxID=1965333 RepID=UPI001D5DC659|nr:hypothetical protein [Prosthecobacter sp.]MCB1275604.1 hypothetical protein [Prosthecobacter sp.]